MEIWTGKRAVCTPTLLRKEYLLLFAIWKHCHSHSLLQHIRRRPGKQSPWGMCVRSYGLCTSADSLLSKKKKDIRCHIINKYIMEVIMLHSLHLSAHHNWMNRSQRLWQLDKEDGSKDQKRIHMHLLRCRSLLFPPNNHSELLAVFYLVWIERTVTFEL